MKRYKKLFKEVKLNKKTIGLIIDYYDQRHSGDVKQAVKTRDKLKSMLKSNFRDVLLKYGDPDDPKVGYMTVRNKWFQDFDAM